MGIKKLNLKYIDSINSFTDLPDTPNTMEDNKLIKVNSDGSAIEFADNPGLSDEIVNEEDYKLDYITGFDMESFSPDTNGYHEKIKINKGFVEIAEPGDLSTNDFWSQNSKMIANYPLRNGQTRDISGHKNNGYVLINRSYGADYPNISYYKKDGNELFYHTEYGTTNDFLTEPLYDRDYYTILDNNKLTISCKVKYFQNVTDFRYIFCDVLRNTNDGRDYRIFQLGQNGMSQLRVYIFNDSNNGSNIRFDIPASLNTGQWYHFYFEIDADDASNTFKFYVDNVEQSHTIYSDSRGSNTNLLKANDPWISIQGLFYNVSNYICPCIVKSALYFNRILTSTERNYIHNNEYLIRGLNTSPNSDIYELPNDVEIDTENLTSGDFIDDTFTTPLESRWYYIYVQPSSVLGECEIKLSAHAPIRNRFNVEKEDNRNESLYHPYLNARCIGVFKYGDWESTTIIEKVSKFKAVDGYFQISNTINKTRTSNNYASLNNSNSKFLPTNVYSIILRVYFNALVGVSGGLNKSFHYQRQLQRDDGNLSYRTLFYKVHRYDLDNMGEDIYWRTKVSTTTERVYLQVYGFYFCR